MFQTKMPENNTQLREKEIKKLQMKLITTYSYVMSIIFFLYAMIFIFYMKDSFLVFYLFLGIAFLLVSWPIVRNRYPLHLIVRVYFILAPLYNLLIMIQFWNFSVASFVWLVPIPFGAYVFFQKKEIIIYSLYGLSTILAAYILANSYDFHFIKHPREKIRYSDTLLFISNIFVVWLIVYYKEKIKTLELLSFIEKERKIQLPITMNERETENNEELFRKIEKVMKEEQLYKDPDFNISRLSTVLKISNGYVSKAIRMKEFSNFKSYINSYRVKYAKTLLQSSDMEKVTMMYIYTEAGFTSQSTFNRVFKEIEGITPSEYVHKMKI